MSKLVAVEGCTIDYSIDGDPLGSVELLTQIVPSQSKVSAGGAKTYVDKLSITVLSGTVTLSSTPEGASASTGTITSPLPGTIDVSGTSEKATSEGKASVLLNDEGSATFVCAFPASPSGTVPSDVTIKATVTDAGQNVTKVT